MSKQQRAPILNEKKKVKIVLSLFLSVGALAAGVFFWNQTFSSAPKLVVKTETPKPVEQKKNVTERSPRNNSSATPKHPELKAMIPPTQVQVVIPKKSAPDVETGISQSETKNPPMQKAPVAFEQNEKTVEAKQTLVPEIKNPEPAQIEPSLREPAAESTATPVLPALEESLFNWRGKSKLQSEHRDAVINLLGELSAVKAGQVELGGDESGGKYFHFYIPNENRELLEAKLKELLGDSFYSRHVYSKDKKAKAGHTRVVFVLYSAPITRTVAAAVEEKEQKSVEETKATEEKPSQPKTELPKTNPTKRHFQFKLFPSNSFFNATDNTNSSKANFASNTNFGLSGSYVQHLSPEYHLSGEMQLTQMKFNPIDSRALGGASQLYIGYGLTLDRHYSQFTLTSSLGIKDTPFIHGVSSGNLEIERISVPYLASGVCGTLASFESGFHVDAAFIPRVLFPANSSGISSKLGYGVQTKLTSVDEQENGNAYFLGLGILYEKQKSDVVDQSYFEGALEFGFRWGACR